MAIRYLRRVMPLLELPFSVRSSDPTPRIANTKASIPTIRNVTETYHDTRLVAIPCRSCEPRRLTLEYHEMSVDAHIVILLLGSHSVSLMLVGVLKAIDRSGANVGTTIWQARSTNNFPSDKAPILSQPLIRPLPLPLPLRTAARQPEFPLKDSRIHTHGSTY